MPFIPERETLIPSREVEVPHTDAQYLRILKRIGCRSQGFPERELPRFRKEASILRTETFGSHFVKARANDSPHEKRLDRRRKYHMHHRKGRNHDQAAAEYPSDAPNREVDERAWGPSGTKSCWNLSLHEYSDVHTQNCTCGT